MSAFNRILQATVLLALSTLLLQGPVLAGPPADSVPVDITGELTVMYMDDFENKRAELQHFIVDKQSNKQYRLQFDGTPPGHLRSGATVKVRGKAKGREIILAADGTGEQNIEIISPAATAVTGEQNTLVIVADLLDASVPCSDQDIRDIVFTDPNDNSIDDLYQENSFGQVWLTGQVAGRYTLDHYNDSCNLDGWSSAADAAARADGINVDGYARKVYVLPGGACPGAGYGTVLGNPTRSWILKCDFRDVYAHELGHNLGMAHASSPGMEYGDLTDFMGIGNNKLRHNNAPHKDQMGWLQGSQIQTITQSGTYDIAPLEPVPANTLAPQAMKIFKADTSEYYYLSYRRAIGFDSSLSSISQLDRLAVHRAKGDGSGGNTYLLAQLTDGESYVDSVNGITITVVSHNTDYVTAEVSINGSDPGPICTAATPQVILSPATQSASAGTTLEYTISVKNTDNSACTNNTFSLSNSIPTGWTGTLSRNSLSLAPGQTGSATFWVTSATSAIASTYGISANVSGSDSVHTASGNASYSVVNSCTQTIPGLTLSPSSQNGDPGATLTYNITLTNNDSSSCGSSTFNLAHSLLGGLTGSLSHSSLILSPGSQGSASLSVSSSTETVAGSHDIMVSVSDTATATHSASSVGSYVVNDTTQAGDVEAPSAPTGLSASSKPNQINLSWNASTDNVGVTGYKIWRNNVLLSATLDTGYIDRAVTSGVTYAYFVEAYDAASNYSAPSNIVTAGKAKAKGKGKGNNQ